MKHYQSIKPCLLLLFFNVLLGCGGNSNVNNLDNVSTADKEACMNSAQKVIQSPQTDGSSSEYYFGNDTIWSYTDSADGVFIDKRIIQSDGTAQMKWPWFHKSTVVGEMSAKGRLVNGNDDTNVINLLESPNEAQAAGIPEGVAVTVSYMVFPAEGCWEITATKGSESITFQTEVIFPQ